MQAAEADELLNDSALQKRTTSLLSPDNGKNIVFFFLFGRINLSVFSRGGKCFPQPQNEETSPFSTLFNSNGRLRPRSLITPIKCLHQIAAKRARGYLKSKQRERSLTREHNGLRQKKKKKAKISDGNATLSHQRILSVERERERRKKKESSFRW